MRETGDSGLQDRNRQRKDLREGPAPRLGPGPELGSVEDQGENSARQDSFNAQTLEPTGLWE
jgi:hypothetical protein